MVNVKQLIGMGGQEVAMAVITAMEKKGVECYNRADAEQRYAGIISSYIAGYTGSSKSRNDEDYYAYKMYQEVAAPYWYFVEGESIESVSRAAYFKNVESAQYIMNCIYYSLVYGPIEDAKGLVLEPFKRLYDSVVNNMTLLLRMENERLNSVAKFKAYVENIQQDSDSLRLDSCKLLDVVSLCNEIKVSNKVAEYLRQHGISCKSHGDIECKTAMGILDNMANTDDTTDKSVMSMLVPYLNEKEAKYFLCTEVFNCNETDAMFKAGMSITELSIFKKCKNAALADGCKKCQSISEDLENLASAYRLSDQDKHRLAYLVAYLDLAGNK